MRFAIIESGAVTNTAIAEVALEENWIASDTASIGDLWDGESFTSPPTAPDVPQSVTMRQARLALLGAELLDDVDAALAAIPETTARRAAQIEWEYAATVDRTSTWVVDLSAALGLTKLQLDTLFISAAAL